MKYIQSIAEFNSSKDQKQIDILKDLVASANLTEIKNENIDQGESTKIEKEDDGESQK